MNRAPAHRPTPDPIHAAYVRAEKLHTLRQAVLTGLLIAGALMLGTSGSPWRQR